jgi:hypothetical protein
MLKNNVNTSVVNLSELAIPEISPAPADETAAVEIITIETHDSWCAPPVELRRSRKKLCVGTRAMLAAQVYEGRPLTNLTAVQVGLLFGVSVSTINKKRREARKLGAFIFPKQLRA